MKITRVVLRLGVILAVVGSILGLVGISLIGTSIYLNLSQPIEVTSDAASSNPVQFQSQANQTSAEDHNQRTLPTLTPTGAPSTPAPTSTTVKPTPTEQVNPSDDSLPTPVEQDSSEAIEAVSGRLLITETTTITDTGILTDEVERNTVTNTIAISSTDLSADITVESTPQVEEEIEYIEPYTSTNQVQPPPSAGSNLESKTTSLCPTTSEAVFDLIPIEGRPLSDHPDFMHADLNLALRGYTPVSETLRLTFYNGSTDPTAPQLHGLFEPNRVPQIRHVYQVNEWIWEAGKCEGNPRGCRGEPITEFWPVTMVGLAVTPGESIYIPERGSEIYRGGYIGMVLYAERTRITLGYTRRDNVAGGYTIHLENFCVDPNLLALYQAQRNAEGWRTSGFLPALRNNQAIGVALGKEIRVAVRDAGSFMDPRSEKDWWRR